MEKRPKVSRTRRQNVGCQNPVHVCLGCAEETAVQNGSLTAKKSSADIVALWSCRSNCGVSGVARRRSLPFVMACAVTSCLPKSQQGQFHSFPFFSHFSTRHTVAVYIRRKKKKSHNEGHRWTRTKKRRRVVKPEWRRNTSLTYQCT